MQKQKEILTKKKHDLGFDNFGCDEIKGTVIIKEDGEREPEESDFENEE